MIINRKGSNMKNAFKKWKKYIACFLSLPWRVNVKMNGMVYSEEGMRGTADF